MKKYALSVGKNLYLTMHIKSFVVRNVVWKVQKEVEKDTVKDVWRKTEK